MDVTKCSECGNTRKFVHKTTEYEVLYYNEHGDVDDSKSIEIMESILVACGVCNANMTDDGA